MRRRSLIDAAVVASAVMIVAWLLAGTRLVSPRAAEDGQQPERAPAASEESKKSDKEKDTVADIFGTAKLWTIHLELTAAEYEAMQPPAPTFPAFPGGPARAPPKTGAKPPAKAAAKPRDAGPPRASERNLFGQEFPWSQADLTVDGATYRKVGVRYDGEGSYFAAARSLKRSFKIDLERFEKHRFHGLTTLNLHCGVLDPTKAREALAYAVFRAAGVPAPRTALAEVTLTVPGRYDKEYLGLYTIVEQVDGGFLRHRFRTDKGLLMRPPRMRHIEFLGEDWSRYVGQYQPRSEATKEQAKWVIDFARLVNQADDEQFRREVGSLLDVDEFLRFLAANALLSNVDGFFGFGGNYYLYLHPATGKLLFIPGDVEAALAGFSFLGTAEQLMDLSLRRPYPGDNKLTERLLAIKEISQRHQQLLKELSAGCFAKERLLAEIETLEKATKELLAKEAKAAAARRETAAGFGGFGPPGAPAGPPSLRTFVEKRTASVAAQLAGKSKGYIPRFGFGPAPGGPGGLAGPGGGAKQPPIDERSIRQEVQAPAEFEVTLFGAPPQVGYPVAIAAAPSGEVFVAADEQGSLGRTPGGGKLLRCIDRNGDGKADAVNVFAKMEHPRGVVVQNGSAWVLHPPLLTVFHDDNGDGTADRKDVLVTGLTTDLIDTRGGDHTTNGIRVGIDGWLYIAVGDYGIRQARGKDGAKLSLRGGGIVRVRPDGTELELFAAGLRNPFDIAIDPYLNLFTRDNTNDGAGWDVRVSHLVQTGQYGYTQLYANFADEIMPPLGQFGGGGGTGALYLQDPRWPEKYRDILYTGDWGRSEVYAHSLRPHGATFDLRQEVFLKIPRPTGMDLDAAGRLYVASWRGGEASVYLGPTVGFVARVTPRGLKPSPVPDLKAANLQQLLGHMGGPNAVVRLHAQREVLRRGRSAEATESLAKLAIDAATRLDGRVAALFALKQSDGKQSHETLLRLAEDKAVREFALRALTDRKGELDGIDAKPFIAALADESPRVQAQALISLARLGDASVAKSIIPLTSRPKGSAMPTKRPVHAQPDPDRVVPHLAVRALVSLGAVDACLEALDGPHHAGALQALRSMHDKRAVDGLVKKLSTAFDTGLRRDILAALIRLYHREADYDGTWWGIRPDNTGPYYDPRPWEQSKRIGTVVTRAVLDGDPATAEFLRAQLARHQVRFPGLPNAADTSAQAAKESQQPITIPKANPKDPNQNGNLTYEVAAERTLRAKGDAAKGRALFEGQSCRACHTDADGQTPKGPHLVDIGERYSPADLIESILKPSAKLAQGYETYAFRTSDGLTHTGFVVSESAAAVRIRDVTGVARDLKREEIEARQRQTQSAMPDGIANNLTPEQLADLVAYLRSLE